MKPNFLCICSVAALNLFSPFNSFAEENSNPEIKQSEQIKNSEDQGDLDVQADSLEYLPDGAGIVAKGNVIIINKQTCLRGDQVTVNPKTGDFSAIGDVILNSDLSRWSGDLISGNFNSKSFKTENCQAQHGPWEITAVSAERALDPTEEVTDPKDKKKAKKDKKKEIIEATIVGAKCSTCNHLHKDGQPHYHIASSKIVIKSNGTMVVHHAVFKLGKVPIFYLPRLWLNKDATGVFNVEAGYKSRWGGYLLFSRKYKINENLTNTWKTGYRTKNGAALGTELDYQTDRNKMNLELFGTQDKDTPTMGSPYYVTPPGDYNGRFEAEDPRYRAKFDQVLEASKNLTLRQHYDKLSDIDMLEDWYDREFDNVGQPKSEASLDYYKPSYEVTLKARNQMNDFYSAVERMPELRLNTFRRQIGSSGWYHQSESTAASMKMKWRDTDLARINGLADLEDYKTNRFDTMQSIYMPLHYNKWLNITPRAGLRLTQYSDTSDRDVSTEELNANDDIADPDNLTGIEPVANYDDNGGDAWRLAGEFGTEVSFKKFKTWNNYTNDTLRLDGVRHVVEPYMNVTSITKPTEDKENIYYFDDVDRIDELNFVRLGTRQRFQTRRDRQIYTFATVDNYMDFHATTRDNYENLGDFGTRATYSPYENLTAYTRMLIGMDEGNLNEFEVGTIFGDKQQHYHQISYIFRNDYQSAPSYSMNSYLDNYGSSTYFERDYERSHIIRYLYGFPINQKTRGEVSFFYDIVRGRLVEQMYEIQRDLHCWKGAFRVGIDDEEFKFMVLFYLTDVPGFKVQGGM